MSERERERDSDREGGRGRVGGVEKTVFQTAAIRSIGNHPLFQRNLSAPPYPVLPLS